MSDVLESLRSDLESLCEEGLINKVTLRDFEQRNMIRLEQISSKHSKVGEG
jgi:hypothetical protein